MKLVQPLFIVSSFNVSMFYKCQYDVSYIFFNFQSDTRRYQNNNAVGLEYTVSNTPGIVLSYQLIMSRGKHAVLST